MKESSSSHLEDEELIALVEQHKSNPHIERCEPCRLKYEEFERLIGDMSAAADHEPSETVAWELSAAIARETKAQQGDQKRMGFYQMAAAVALVLVGFVGGYQLKSADNSRVAELEQEVGLLKELTLINALNESTASERISVVNQIETNSDIGDKLLESLFHTLNADKSPNVRYEAVQAISKFSNDDKVRLRMVRSLKNQTEPLVQIALIQVLVKANEKAAVSAMKEIQERENTVPEVRRQAEIALQILI